MPTPRHFSCGLVSRPRAQELPPAAGGIERLAGGAPRPRRARARRWRPHRRRRRATSTSTPTAPASLNAYSASCPECDMLKRAAAMTCAVARDALSWPACHARRWRSAARPAPLQVAPEQRPQQPARSPPALGVAAGRARGARALVIAQQAPRSLPRRRDRRATRARHRREQRAKRAGRPCVLRLGLRAATRARSAIGPPDQPRSRGGYPLRLCGPSRCTCRPRGGRTERPPDERGFFCETYAGVARGGGDPRGRAVHPGQPLALDARGAARHALPRRRGRGEARALRARADPRRGGRSAPRLAHVRAVGRGGARRGEHARAVCAGGLRARLLRAQRGRGRDVQAERLLRPAGGTGDRVERPGDRDRLAAAGES